MTLSDIISEFELVLINKKFMENIAFENLLIKADMVSMARCKQVSYNISKYYIPKP